MCVRFMLQTKIFGQKSKTFFSNSNSRYSLYNNLNLILITIYIIVFIYNLILQHISIRFNIFTVLKWLLQSNWNTYSNVLEICVIYLSWALCIFISMSADLAYVAIWKTLGSNVLSSLINVLYFLCVCVCDL